MFTQFLDILFTLRWNLWPLKDNTNSTSLFLIESNRKKDFRRNYMYPSAIGLPGWCNRRREANGSLSFSSSRKESLISWLRKNSKVSWVALGQEHQDGRESRQSKLQISERVFTLDKSCVRKGKERFRWRRSRFRRLSRVSPEVAAESSDRCPGPRLPNNISRARHLHNH